MLAYSFRSSTDGLLWFRFPLKKFLHPKALVCLLMGICFIIMLTWSSMLLIWHGILLFDFLHSWRFLEKGSLLILLMWLMTIADISHGVHRDQQNLDSSSDRSNWGNNDWLISLNIDYMFLSSSSYGNMPAHSFLWRECEKSSGDVAARLAVIPLVQEARGLDAGPRLVKNLIGFGDHRTSDIVAKIADEEVAHVAVGVYWFVSVCQRMGRVPSSTFEDILDEYNVELKGPFNHSAREEAGMILHPPQP